MTTSVTIKNNGPYRVNVNEVDVVREDAKTVQSHTLEIGGEVTLNLWGAHRYLNILETNDVDTPDMPTRESDNAK